MSGMFYRYERLLDLIIATAFFIAHYLPFLRNPLWTIINRTERRSHRFFLYMENYEFKEWTRQRIKKETKEC